MKYSLEPAVSDKPKRRWYQFSLQTLFVWVTAFCLFVTWGVHEGGRRNRTIHRLHNAGAGLTLGHKLDNQHGVAPGSQVLKLVLGEFYATQVHQIELTHPEVFTDHDARDVSIFTELDWLAISNSLITDEGLEHIAKLSNLGRLDIEGCKLSKQAVKKLRQELPKARIYSDFSDQPEHAAISP